MLEEEHQGQGGRAVQGEQQGEGGGRGTQVLGHIVRHHGAPLHGRVTVVEGGVDQYVGGGALDTGAARTRLAKTLEQPGTRLTK